MDLNKISKILAEYNATLDCVSPDGNRILIHTKSGKAIWLSYAATILGIIPDYVMEV